MRESLQYALPLIQKILPPSVQSSSSFLKIYNFLRCCFALRTEEEQMAATLVGGAFLSATVQTLVEKLASAEFRDYIRNTKLNGSLLRQLQTTLLTLQLVLDDAEEKQIDNSAVKQWLDDLKDAVFDAEDLLNQISYDSLRCKVENKQAENKINQVWKILSSPFNTFYTEINSQMKIMCERLQLFAQHKDVLGLQTQSGRVAARRTPSSSMVNESVMVGRMDDKEKLVNMSLSDSGTSRNYNMGVVAILGMGGVGKTTLAQLVYNDTTVQEHFDLKAWACVSDDYDILRVTKTLLESITSRACESNNLDFLRVELKKNLRDRRFLFVLDDLWNDSYNDWDELMTPFIDGKSGSRVIVTTRQQNVAEVVHAFPIKLETLSDEDCWSLLSKHAFGNEGFHGNKSPNLEAIGRKIARKCDGLPLAAKTLGGLLRSKVDAKQWTEILDSNIWQLKNNDILPSLFLSYQYLPSHLKRCFAYCSIFPKDYQLDKKQLILLWTAEGFLELSQGENTAEAVADDCFAELLSRSLIQKPNNDTDGKKFIMHDLVHDLATVVSGKSCCRLECGGDISENVRHLSYNQELHDIFKKFEILRDFKCLRSFLPIRTWWVENHLSTKVVNDLLPSLHRLRVLSLSGYINITMLPDSIGSLVQLRYLDLSRTRIKSLPDTTCNLYNLQTLLLSQCGDLTMLPDSIGSLVQLRYLDLYDTKINSLPDTICNLYNLQTLILLCCSNVTELPVHIGKLVNLRHLDISGTRIMEMPKQIVGLENLKTLTVFAVGKQEAGLSIKDLEKLPKLQGRLTITNLHNVNDAMGAYDANLKSKECIEELKLQWGRGEQIEDSQTVKNVLDMLIPSVNIKKLSIELYGGTSFPSWLGDSSFSNMVFLSISGCKNCVTLPPLGQLPSLKDLMISGMVILEKVGPEFYGMEGGGSNSSFQPFPSLEFLQFQHMSNWKEWLPFEGDKFPFPQLKTLQLIYCRELRGHLPNHLSSIENIDINCCDRLLATPHTLHWLSSIKNINVEGDYKRSTERFQWSLLESDSPCLLQRAVIHRCDTLLSVPKMILRSTCLQHLELTRIPSLTAFPADGLPTSLKSLSIGSCEKLSFLPSETWRNYTSLVDLRLSNSCDALTSFQLDGFPALQRLSIDGCRSLESIFISETSSLCPSTLRSFAVYSCDALRSLPQRMDTLTALEELTLQDLREVDFSFGEGACLLPKLQSIHISIKSVTKPVAEWGFQRLTALSELWIRGGDDIVKTLLKERLLPISLVSLTIGGLSEMKSLEGNGLRHLSSLRELKIQFCSRLESLEEVTLPSSLETLKFYDCPRIESLREDKLPSSLKLLSIGRCPLLEARYESKSDNCNPIRSKIFEVTEHWSNVAHIPLIIINSQELIWK